jgi:[ribosomal protein S18]-alanine N-acetyltransferase
MLKSRLMAKYYVIRTMEQGDIRQVAQIDREAFPGEWIFRTQSAYKQDLENPSIRYVVAYDKDGATESKPPAAQKLTWLRSAFGAARRTDIPQDIVGFSGFWMMLREAHIIAIGVRSGYRGLGIGEALLIATIDLAQTLDAYVVTLEVRASNKIAQELYKKFGFREVGRRVKYYSSDGEDALIMTTDNIGSVPFQASLRQLKKAHAQEHREILFRVR